MKHARMLFTVLILAAAVTQAGAAGFKPSKPVKRAKSSNSLILKASFEETFDRYPSPYAIIEQFKLIAPVRGYEYGNECLQMGEKGGPVGGVIDPLQNGALEQEPGFAFYQFYQDCVRSLVSSAFGNQQWSNAQEILGLEVTAKTLNDVLARCALEANRQEELCRYGQDTLNKSLWTAIPWMDFPEANRKELIRAIINYLIGPEVVLRASGYLDDATMERPIRTVEEFVDQIYQATNQEFDGKRLSFAETYAEIAIFLRLGPALKS